VENGAVDPCDGEDEEGASLHGCHGEPGWIPFADLCAPQVPERAGPPPSAPSQGELSGRRKAAGTYGPDIYKVKL